MKINLQSSLKEIEKAGEFLCRNVNADGYKETPIFYRVLNSKGTVESIHAARWSELTFVQKIKFFFGYEEFSLNTIERLFRATFESKAQKQKFFKLSEKDRAAIAQSFCMLSMKIISHNSPKWNPLRFISRDTAPIDLQPMESLREELRMNVLQEAAPSRRDLVQKLKQPIPSVGRGIINPGCLCYCNSVIQLIHSSTKLKNAIWKDEENTTDALIHSLEALNAELKKQKPNIENHSLDEDRQRIFDECPSLRTKLIDKNIPSLIKDVPAFITKLQNQKRVRESLREVLAALDQKGTQLSHKSNPMKPFITAMEHLFPELKNIDQQQDAALFFLSILEAILPPETREGENFQVSKFYESTDTPKKLQEKLLSGEIPPTVQNLVAASEIASLKSTDAELTPLLVLHPSKGKKNEAQSLTEVFLNPTTQDLYLENFATAEYNPWLTDAFLAILRRAADKKGKIPPIPCFEVKDIKDVPPTFLPINIARFSNEGAVTSKNTHPVKAPFHLEVHKRKDDSSVSYTLKGITVHHGVDQDGGHYITYIPQPSSPVDEDGVPTKWIELSDDSVHTRSWKLIRKDVEQNATLYMYDLN